ncbi:AbrB/MazE/SpoVT family DNA-binding domain-containing protein [Candidatus Parcubacteria bacterium]|nr:AbrB/MazE/SpoVT family DNA-binding domain-containing protein [Candidatus Parcubacteria bacterium]
MRRKLKNNEIRKIYSHGNSLGVTLPREVLDELRWRKGQKLVIKKRAKGILISDWEK